MPTDTETPRVLGPNIGPEPFTTPKMSFGFQIGHRKSTSRSTFFALPGAFRFGCALALAATLGAAAACGGKDSTSPIADPECVIPTTSDFRDSTAGRVVISNFEFHPATITIKVGQTVKWKHCGPEVDQHTVTSATGTLLDSDYISKGQTYSKQFDVAATNAYHCIPHSEYMMGNVIVQP